MNQFRRYLSALVSQAFVSLFHFALNVFLIQALVESDYGTFALAFAISLISASVTNALFTVPLSVFGPAAADEDERRNIDGTLNRGAYTFAAGVLVVGLAWALVAAIQGSAWTAATAAGFIATYALRQHGRGLQYANFRASIVLAADVAYVLVSVAAIAGVHAMVELSAPWILAGLSTGNLVSIAALLRGNAFTPNDRQRLSTAYRPYWKEAKWALLGAVSTMVVAQGHSVVVSAIRNPEIFAPLAAGYVVFGPVRVMFATIQNVLRPEMAKSIAEGDARSALRQAALASIASLLGVLAVSGLVLVAWQPISERLYSERYGDEPMAAITIMWAVVSVAAGLGSGPSALLQSMRQFRPLAIVGFLSGALNLSLVSAVVVLAPVHYTILSVAGAEATMTLGLIVLIYRHKRLVGP